MSSLLPYLLPARLPHPPSISRHYLLASFPLSNDNALILAFPLSLLCFLDKRSVAGQYLHGAANEAYRFHLSKSPFEGQILYPARRRL
ncbi:hypothetical protein BT96DRAFT_304357 [Gymnopus androsaceus JB14]|uniref:Uncharacterized protein n=1 Tax=Gymnopus androsaceus JB14 TaxID=1447944 RepID=A0A6A4H2W0_9AGAR|nr:hypothetical protein BT96DRAFT_304357 [Gymnopus androsaceus JB14]